MNLKKECEVRVLVDADACPVVGIIEQIAGNYHIPVMLLCDTNHVLESLYSTVKLRETPFEGAEEAEQRG